MFLLAFSKGTLAESSGSECVHKQALTVNLRSSILCLSPALCWCQAFFIIITTSFKISIGKVSVPSNLVVNGCWSLIVSIRE